MADDQSITRDDRDPPPPPAPSPRKPARRPLPPWKVLLHNDEVNEIGHVIETILRVTPLGEEDAAHKTLEAHVMGVTTLLTTHRERAELYQQQFQRRNLTVSIEPE